MLCAEFLEFVIDGLLFRFALVDFAQADEGLHIFGGQAVHFPGGDDCSAVRMVDALGDEDARQNWVAGALTTDQRTQAVFNAFFLVSMRSSYSRVVCSMSQR